MSFRVTTKTSPSLNNTQVQTHRQRPYSTMKLVYAIGELAQAVAIGVSVNISHLHKLKTYKHTHMDSTSTNKQNIHKSTGEVPTKESI